MTLKIDGSCHCGAIEFEAEIDPDQVRICHCNDCQKLSGSAFRVTAPCPEAQFRLLRGVPKQYIKVADSGRQRIQAFCSECGSAIYTTSVGEAHRTIGIRVGVINQRTELTPKRQLWHRSALPWIPELPGTVADTE